MSSGDLCGLLHPVGSLLGKYALFVASVPLGFPALDPLPVGCVILLLPLLLPLIGSGCNHSGLLPLAGCSASLPLSRDLWEQQGIIEINLNKIDADGILTHISYETT